MSAAPLAVPLPGGDLHALRWGDGEHTIVALHGISGSALSWQAVARRLPEDCSLIALDLRGRGASGHLPGPYGLRRHVGDVLAAVGHLGLSRPTLAGHSLGAVIALLATAAGPGTFARLVLVDGGLPLPVPDGADLDVLLEQSLGPALERLRRTYPDARAYLDFWRAHPALAECWNKDVEDYVRYDLTGEDGALRSRVREEAVRTDGRDLLASGPRLGEALLGLDLPTLLLTAPGGMFGPPPGLLPAELVATWRERVPRLDTELVPGTNHYSIILDPDAAALVARRLAAPSGHRA